MWMKFYLPKQPLAKNVVILDAGAGEGETILFFAGHGYHKFVAVENDPLKCDRLRNNTRHLDVEVRERAFRVEDLIGIDYAKLDIEGGEKELLELEHLPCEMTVEIHDDRLLQELSHKFPLKVVHRFGSTDEPVYLAKSD